MTPFPDDLSGLKDDMIAFIEGHGLRRFHGYVDYEEVQAIMWKSGENSDGWKDFVELAKAANVAFLTMDDVVLSKEDLEFLIDRLKDGDYSDDLEDARWLRTYIGKMGFVQLGFAHQGSIFLYEASTEWYDRYQHVLDTAEAIGGLLIEEDDENDE